jgi:hypothetical protein
MKQTTIAGHFNTINVVLPGTKNETWFCKSQSYTVTLKLVSIIVTNV